VYKTRPFSRRRRVFIYNSKTSSLYNAVPIKSFHSHHHIQFPKQVILLVSHFPPCSIPSSGPSTRRLLQPHQKKTLSVLLKCQRLPSTMRSTAKLATTCEMPFSDSQMVSLYHSPSQQASPRMSTSIQD
jgi:hypothetical protein